MHRIAIISFPGNNCEVESIRAIRRCGMEPVFFRWNDDRAKLADIDGYFIVGGFSYEDRGRAGMVAARDPLLDHIGQEAAAGKPVIGNCNGAQILIESKLIPLGDQLDMCLARNARDGAALGFLNEWVFVTPTCARDRCVTSDWAGAMHMPLAHGEGRYTTRDKDLYNELKQNDQIAFSYCDEQGTVSQDPLVTPNGSELAIAGICNPAGNVVALMPHPERTTGGDEYFASMKRWLDRQTASEKRPQSPISNPQSFGDLSDFSPASTELFIDTLITNNEERTVEQAAHHYVPDLKLKQLKYVSLSNQEPADVLQKISFFNPNKEVAYVRRGDQVYRWNSSSKQEEALGDSPLSDGFKLLRIEEPNTDTGVCYVCKNVDTATLQNTALLEIFVNPHSATLYQLH